jgi:cytoskeletal protein CcmA (bactofilin family)
VKKFNPHKRFFTRCFINEKGVILPITVLLLIVLTLLILVGAKWAQMDVKRTKDYTKTRQAFYVAESGIQMGLNELNFGGPNGNRAADGFDEELAMGDGASWGVDWPAATFNYVDYAPNGGTPGQYTVTLTDNNDGDGLDYVDADNTVILRSTGVKQNKVSSIEAILYRGEFVSSRALITDQNLTLDGNSFHIGGDVHANGDMINNGNTPTQITGDASVTGTCGDSIICGDGGDEIEIVPLITHDMFENDYKLGTSNGIDIIDVVLKEGVENFEWRNIQIWDTVNNVMTGTGNFTFEQIQTTVMDYVGGIPTSINYVCWKPLGDTSPTRCDGSDPNDPNAAAPPSGTNAETQQNFYKLVKENFGSVDRTGNNVWKFNGINLPQNVYIYVEQKNATEGGRIKVLGTGPPGSPPWNVSIVSTGAVEIQGGTIQNYKKPGLSEGLQDMFVMAGTDFQILGGALLTSATGFLEGYIYARDQIELGGNSKIRGTVLARDDQVSPTSGNPPNSGSPLSPDEQGLISANKIHGNFSIDFTPDTVFDLPGPVRILSWREIEVVS